MRHAASGIVTTSPKPHDAQVEAARQLASQTGLPYIELRSSCRRARRHAGADYALVLDKVGLKIAWDGGELRHHPGLSIYRVGDARSSPMLRALGLTAGDSVMDATLGLGRDALLLADRTGAPVLGFERHPAIAALTAAGLRTLARRRPFKRAAPLVRVVCDDGFATLAGLSRGAVDHVVLDPMFPEPVRGARDMEVLHKLVRPEPFDAEVLRLAAAAASRRVVLRWPAGQPLPSVGFDRVLANRRHRVLYLALNLDRAATRRRLRRR